MTYAAVAVLLALSAPASTAPTYLACMIQAQTGPFEVDLTIDEPSQSVTTAMPSTGHAERLAAVFAPATVSFRTAMLSYVVSRTDLSIERMLTIGGKAWVDRGTCHLQKVPKRKF